MRRNEGLWSQSGSKLPKMPFCGNKEQLTTRPVAITYACLARSAQEAASRNASAKRSSSVALRGRSATEITSSMTNRLQQPKCPKPPNVVVLPSLFVAFQRRSAPRQKAAKTSPDCGLPAGSRLLVICVSSPTEGTVLPQLVLSRRCPRAIWPEVHRARTDLLTAVLHPDLCEPSR